MATLPAGLKPVVDGYAFDDPGGVMRTDVAGGAPRYALDWDRGTQRFSVTLILDANQFSIWTLFYHRVIAKGSISFDMPLDSGFGVQPHTVNIIPGSYSAARTSGIMTVVSFVAEAENPVYGMSNLDVTAIMDAYGLYGNQTTALLDTITRFANHDLLALNF
jgi:hypothetical protein